MLTPYDSEKVGQLLKDILSDQGMWEAFSCFLFDEYHNLYISLETGGRPDEQVDQLLIEIEQIGQNRPASILTDIVSFCSDHAPDIVQRYFPEFNPPDGAHHKGRGLWVGQSLQDERFLIQRVLDKSNAENLYVAWDDRLQTSVAIKVFVPELHEDPERERAAFEANVVKMERLSNSNEPTFVRIITTFEYEDTQCTVMPLYPQSLADKGFQAGLAQERAVDLFRQLCRGIRTAHTRFDFLHTHLKPSNILLDSDGTVKIANFGAPLRDNVTPFIAPEQLKDESVTKRTDIYALGALFYYLLTGKAPFHLRYLERYRVLDEGKILEDEPDWQPLYEKRVPKPWIALIRQCMAKDPAARPPDVDAILQQLERKSRSRLVLTGSIVAVLVVLAGIFFFRRNVQSTSPPFVATTPSAYTKITAATPTTPPTATVDPGLTSNQVEAPVITTVAPSEPAIATTTPDPPFAPPAASILIEILERGYLNIGVKQDLVPFGFIDDVGQGNTWERPLDDWVSCDRAGQENWVGFDLDLAEALATTLEIDCRFVPVTSEDRYEAVTTGRVDLVIASMTHNWERDWDLEIDFSQNYFADQAGILVNAARNNYQSLDDLQAGRVAALKGSNSYDIITARNRTDALNMTVISYTETLKPINDLKNGDLDAFITDQAALKYFETNNAELVMLDEALSPLEPYGFGLPEDDSPFRDLVNAALQKLKREGTYATIFKRWLGDDYAPYDIEILQGTWPAYTLAGYVDNLAQAEGLVYERSAVSLYERIVKDGYRLRVGVKDDFLPFSDFDEETQRWEGFEPDLIRRLSEYLYNEPGAIELVPVTTQNRFDHLKDGTVDLVVASTTRTLEREVTYDFSQVYYFDWQGVLLPAGDLQIETVADLQDLAIAANDGSTSATNIVRWVEDEILKDNLSAEETLRSRDDIRVEVVPVNGKEEALTMLEAGRVRAYTADLTVLMQLVIQNPDQYRLLEDRAPTEPFGFVMRPNDSRFRDHLNRLLQITARTGVYDALYRKWFTQLHSSFFRDGLTPYRVELWTEFAPSEPVPLNTDQRAVANQTCAAQATTQTYIVEPNDSLSKLARKFYDDLSLWRVIWDANRNLLGDDPDFIEVGWVLTIPGIDCL